MYSPFEEAGLDFKTSAIASSKFCKRLFESNETLPIEICKFPNLSIMMV